MGNRELERGKADRNIFSGDLRGYAADCLFYVLDGKEHSRFLSYFGIFALIFLLIWVIQYMLGRRDVKKMNENLSIEKR